MNTKVKISRCLRMITVPCILRVFSPFSYVEKRNTTDILGEPDDAFSCRMGETSTVEKERTFVL
jgi:hypothetical protein